MYKVLIVDDEELEREGLKYILKDNCNFEVVGTAENGNEAVTKANKLEPDIILMDIKIPGIDGLEASRIIKENNPEIEIVLLTAYSQFSYSHKAIKIKVADYLLKPIKPKQLIEALTNLGEIINKKKYSNG